jgi:hypothetical protein
LIVYELWVFNIGSDALLYLFITTTLELKGRLKHFSDGLAATPIAFIPIQKSKLTRRRAADSTPSTARRANEVIETAIKH